MTATGDRSTAISDGFETGASASRLFERPTGGERALILHVDLDTGDADEAVEEFVALAESAGATIVETVVARRRAPQARFFVGSGKVAELAERVQAEKVELVLVNHDISPAQERNLERALQCRVLDRTGLILDIFAQRARSFEGKLQVELAQLSHMASRLVRGWSHLERQQGGIGLRGPGETQLELDRRMLGIRIKQIKRRLQKVRRQRDQGRQARRKRDLPAVSLVGYTNAGKSTLFNRITESGVFAADQLFATLDTTLRGLELPNGQPIVLADTVGFIRDLPHQLVAAFRSTLEEVVEADLLLHIIDAASDTRDEEIRQVEAVLTELGAAEVPVLYVYNKIDLLAREPALVRDEHGEPVEVWLSAEQGQGVPLLMEALAERVGSHRVRGTIRLAASEGRLRARLYDLGEVLGEHTEPDGATELVVDLPRRDLERLYSREGLTARLEPLDNDAAQRRLSGRS